MQIKCNKRIEKLEELISENIFIFRRYINIINIVNKYCKFSYVQKFIFYTIENWDWIIHAKKNIANSRNMMADLLTIVYLEPVRLLQMKSILFYRWIKPLANIRWGCFRSWLAIYVYFSYMHYTNEILRLRSGVTSIFSV